MADKRRILFLVPYPVKRAPSQRFRVELFEPVLREAGLSYTIKPFIKESTWDILYKPGNTLRKALDIAGGYLHRLKTVLFEVQSYSHIFIHREAAPLGPPIFEWILTKLWRKKVIYDFDDAIWIPNTGQENKLASALKANWKVKSICKWVDTVVAGNEYLCDFASKYNEHVVCIPTIVDTVNTHNREKEHKTDSIVVGWTGSHSTLPFLEDIIPTLKELNTERPFTLLVIANRKPEFDFPSLMFIPWREETEIDDLLHADIGIMPLAPDRWSEGKCGFKLIQYLSLGIPAVASPVGVNTRIVEHGINGYIAATPAEWKGHISTLMQDLDKRRNFGKSGREKMIRQYSLTSQKEKFLGLFS